MAPEVVEQDYSLPADLWSTGILAYRECHRVVVVVGKEGGGGKGGGSGGT